LHAQHAVPHEPMLDYCPPDWGGAPSIEGVASLELIVKGEVRARVVLDMKAKHFFTVGRAKTCDIVLDGVEPRASRIHCVLQGKAGCPELYVYDLGSAHGTLLNNAPIAPRKFEPLRVGSQLRFTADRRSASDCIAVVCGPESAMEQEGEVELDAYRSGAAKVHAARAKAIEEDLQRRIEAKRQRMLRESKRRACVSHFAEKGRLKMEAAQEAMEEDRKILHTVTWGMSEDAVEPESNLSEGAMKLMDANGRLDLEKVRAMELTDKQQKLIATIDQKQRRLNNLERERIKHEGKCKSHERKRATKKSDMSDEFDDVPDMDPGGKSLELVQNLSMKIDSVEEDVSLQTDNLLLSLGLKKAGEGGRRPKKKNVEMYDTNFASLDDDDFFDRVAVQKATAQDAREAATSSELAGLPMLEKVENLASLEAKAVLFKAERAKLATRLVAEASKGERLQGPEETEDSLDAFMSGTVAELRKDRRERLELRMVAVEARLRQTEALLQVARRNAPESGGARSAEPGPARPAQSVTVSGAAAAVVRAAAANVRAVSTANAAVARAGARTAPERPEARARPEPPSAPRPERPEAKGQAPEGPARPGLDADRGGLQLMGSRSRPGGPEGDMAPPAPKLRRRIYGPARAPGSDPAAARDADLAASGETDGARTDG